MKELFFAHIGTVLAMTLGVAVHVAKKAATMRQTDHKFSLKDYLIGHPYQSFAAIGMSVGAYLQLVSDPTTPLSLFAAFLAGIAVDAMADLAPGDRTSEGAPRETLGKD